VSGIVLALLASACWATLDALRKRLAEPLGPLVLVWWLSLGQVLFFGGWYALDGLVLPAPAYWVPGVAVMLANLAASLLFVAAVRVSPLSLTIPMLSFTPVLTTIFGALVLGEWLGWRQSLGVAAVVVGALVLQAGAVPGGPVAWVRSLLGEKGALWMLGVAGLWSLTGVLDKVALDHVSVPGHGTWQTAGIGLCLTGVLGVRGRLGELARARGHAGWVLGAVAASCGAIALQYLAFLAWIVSLVEAVKRAVGLTASVINGRVFFGEPLGLGKAVGIALMAAGVVALVV
jgi:drug/metabolite transporter (DMT)-like permease